MGKKNYNEKSTKNTTGKVLEYEKINKRKTSQNCQGKKSETQIQHQQKSQLVSLWNHGSYAAFCYFTWLPVHEVQQSVCWCFRKHQ